MKSKEMSAKEYADLIDRSEDGLVEQCFIAGFEAGTPKWINVKDEKPDTWSQHGCIFASDEVLLDCGDFYTVSRYIKKYTSGSNGYSLIWEGFDNIEDQEVIERWQKIIK